VPAYCLHGDEEDDSVCPKLTGENVHVLHLPGGHHYDGDYTGLGKLLLQNWPLRR